MDERADQIIKKEIGENFPRSSYLSEETGRVEKGGSLLWVVDPLDGTGNYENHNPVFSVSIALYEEEKPVLGVIEAPFLGERFWAVKGGGAFHVDSLRKREEEGSVSSVNKLENAYFGYCEGGEKDRERIVDIFGEVYSRAKEVRKIGSAALELSFLGTGRMDGYYTTKIRFWDVAAGLIFAREAGARILHFDGSPYEWKEFFQREEFDLLATNGSLAFDLEGF